MSCNRDMRVSNGWNTDYGKVKFDLSLDDDDFSALLEEYGIPVNVPVTVNEKFGILNMEGLALAKLRLSLVQRDMKQELEHEARRHQQNRDYLLYRLARKHGIEVPKQLKYIADLVAEREARGELNAE